MIKMAKRSAAPGTCVLDFFFFFFRYHFFFISLLLQKDFFIVVMCSKFYNSCLVFVFASSVGCILSARFLKSFPFIPAFFVRVDICLAGLPCLLHHFWPFGDP